MSLKLPKGLTERYGHIHVSFYDPRLKKTRNMSSGFPAMREYIKDAKLFRQQKIKEAKSKYTFTPLVNFNISELLGVYYESKDMADSTKDFYERAVSELIMILEDKPIMDYSEQDFDFFFRKLEKDRGLTKTTCAMYSRHLKALFQFYVKKRIIQNNPVPRLRSPKKPVAIIPKDEVEEMLVKLKEKKNIYAYDLVKFLYCSGFRIGEAIALKWSNIDLEKEIIRFENTKGKKNEVFPINKYLLTHLQEMTTRKFNEEKVFIYTHKSCAFFYKLQKELWGELRYSFHNLRKSFITAIAWSSGNPFVVQNVARHSNIQTSQDYYIEIQAQRIKEEINRHNISAFELAV